MTFVLRANDATRDQVLANCKRFLDMLPAEKSWRGVNPGDLTVGGLAAAIENAIAAAPEFEGSISDRDETIRKLRDPVAVHVAMLRGEIAVPPLANGRSVK